ncbi:MAG: hypothetical protein PHQ04_02795 [Opitutaceae bacterium]|nr:hypothetical protein [Opitutaceae bacterium]
MKTSPLVFGLLACLPMPWAGRAADMWSFEFLGGAPYHFVTPLRIYQSGQPVIKVNARYNAKPFEVPRYYSVRIGAWSGNRAWEMELIHDKIYLKNRPPQVEEFSVSHGYNLLTVNRAWLLRKFVCRLGAGAVVAHPESTVRGKKIPEDRGLFNDGYYLSGPTVQTSLGRRIPLHPRLFLAAEVRLTASFARMPVENGRATVPTTAAHVLFGLGYNH